MKKTIQYTFLLLFGTITLFGQSRKTKVADTYFDNMSYVKAAKEYKKLTKKGYNKYILQRLGDSYYFNVEMRKASVVYAQLFNSYVPENSEYMFKYAQSLRAVGKFEDSKLWMDKFNKANKDDSRGKKFTERKAVLSEIKDNRPAYKIKNLVSINTEYSDYGVTELGNSIVFSSTRKKSAFGNKVHSRNERNFLDLFQISKDEINFRSEISDFSNHLNSIYHESSTTFTSDGKTIYFTRNNFNKGRFKTDRKGINNLKIYKAEFIKDKWVNITELPFCSDDYSVGHPSLSKDEKQLFFTSDMPGGIGETDIYVVEINNDGTFGSPENLGTTINTEGREMFPFVSKDNTLYFSSDGHFGIGSLDIFASKIVDKEFEEPVNLKAPINSKLDDFSFSINPKIKKGYLSSNREGGAGDDDIYVFEELEKKESCIQTVTGVVRELKFKKHLPFANLLLKDALGNVVKDTIADEEGRFSFELPCNKKYVITGSKEYYQPDTKSFETTAEVDVKLNLDLFLKITDDFSYTANDELMIKINNIYFDYDKWGIRPDAVIELDHIVDVMTKYPKIIVKSTSHTDARGKDSYNESLSQRRAESTVDYIIYKGIFANRISGKGYGEYRLTNNCVDNDFHSNRVKCTEDQHQANRRTSFIIVNVDGTKISSEDGNMLSTDEQLKKRNLEIAENRQVIYKTHLVVEGETLSSISKKYNLSIATLKQINNLKVNGVYLNQLLIIDLEPYVIIKKQSKSTSKFKHTVMAFETLQSISKLYETSVNTLIKLNSLTSNNLRVGQILKIK
jgi:outer membrane protein OmpA-like peptidoglycan-associated protein/LysM repeat protein